MATNQYFNLHGTNTPEQRLIENLNIEAIKTFGTDVYYCPRTLNDEDTLMGDDNTSSYNSAHTIEMYIKSVDGFEGEGDFISKFGLQIKDQITFTVARRRWAELNVQGEGRADAPAEGDLIYFPTTESLFQVMFVEDESVFYQTGGLQVYDLLCEMFFYSDQSLNTGIEVIDAIERAQSYSIDFTMNTGSGNYTVGEQVYQGASLAAATVKGEVSSWNATDKLLNLINMTGNFSGTVNIVGDSSSASYSISSFDAQTSAADTAASVDNAEIEAAADAIIDFTEGNPFGSL
ncbi:MAG: hypothetical protein CL704_05010 [Chloroflexi bacterium]|nr:hypothetical protein [Chloroflexota bacterium]|tara:strand:+ start:487 stop:1356 length:870 start_codon:yes stop_codon:yes gene_type:complete